MTSKTITLGFTLLTLVACSSQESPDQRDQAAQAPAALPEALAELGLANALHLAFQPTSTRLEVEGKLEAGESADFVVSAHSGDLLLAHALTPAGDLTVGVYRLDSGAPLADSNASPSSWSGVLPSSIGYLVRIEPPEEATFYALQIEIPRLLETKEEAGISGMTSPHLPVAYRVHAEAGESLRFELTSPQGASFAVHGVDSGHPLVPWTTAATSFEGEAPESQEYVIHVIGATEPTEFELSVSRG